MSNQQQTTLMLILCDPGGFYQIKNYINMVIILLNLITLSSQFVYYLNYKKGISATYVRVFQMMSGLVTPNSVGLYDVNETIHLVRNSKKLFYSLQLSSKLISTRSFGRNECQNGKYL
jgi:hypothetical protein